MTQQMPSQFSHQDLVHMMWRRGDLSWKLDTLQQSILETVLRLEAKKVGILSSRQIGKSFWVVVFVLMYLIRYPNRIARIIAPTRDACLDIIEDNLSKIIEDAPEGMIVPQRKDMRWEIRTAHGTGSLRVGALERQYVDKNRGGNASLVIFEECGFVRADDFTYGVDSVIGPQLLRSKGIEMFVSTPSIDPEHPLHTKIKPQTEALGTFFSYTVYDSPSITPEMIEEAITRCGGADTDAFQREYMARIIRPSMFICVPTFYEPRHVVAFEHPSVCHWQVMIDWGGVKDLTVALLHTWDFIGAKYLIWDELAFQPNTSTPEIAAALLEWEAAWGFRLKARKADVFSQTSIDLANNKIESRPAPYQVSPPTKGPWLAMVNNLAAQFAMDRVLVHPRCELLRRTLRGGMFNKQKTDFERSAELGHCDALASLGYALQNQDLSNPYTEKAAMPESVFVIKSPQSEEERLAKAFNPKQWGTQRTFGAYRK